jgi:DNA-binding FadR family transcriptional regulator
VAATLITSLWSKLAGPEREAVIGRPDDSRLAHEFATILERDFISSGRSGDVIGTLSGIRQRYGLGRWACREAIGILEMRGWLESRRGAGGGLVLTQPSTRDLAKQMLVHLCLKGARVDQVIEARRAVHRAVVRKLMMSGGVPTAPGDLRFSHWLAAQSGNRAFVFLMELVTALYDECAATTSIARVAEEGPLWDAIRSGDEFRASAALDAFLASTERLQAGEKFGLPQVFPRGGSGAGTTHAARLAQWLLRQIAQRGACGTDLGSEAEIGERHRLSRDIVRRATRMLEDIGVVVSKRGRHGGLTSHEPDLAVVVELIAPLLYRRRIPSGEVAEAMLFIKLESVLLAALRVQSSRASGRVGKLVEDLLGTTPKHPHELIMMENKLIELAENDVLAACDRGMLFCGPVMPIEDTDPSGAMASSGIANTRAIIEAIRAGEVRQAEAAFMKKMQDLGADRTHAFPSMALKTA